MALQPCRECGQQVSTEAASCPHCGTPNPTGIPPKQKPAEKEKAGCGKAGCLGLIVFAMIVWAIGELGGGGSEPSPEEVARAAERDRMFNAQFACENAVEARLVSPRTAKFSQEKRGYLNSEEGIDSTRIIVHGVVDAQNRMGGEIRNNYQCIYRIEGENLMTEDVQILGR